MRARRSLWAGLLMAAALVVNGSGIAWAVPVLDQSQNASNIGLPANRPLGQSFTAGITGFFVAFRIYLNGPIAPQGFQCRTGPGYCLDAPPSSSNTLTYELLAGNGTGGTVLGVETQLVNSADESPTDGSVLLSAEAMGVKLTAGSAYTFLITEVSGPGNFATTGGVTATFTSSYAGGAAYQSNYGPGALPFDLKFQTFVEVGEPSSWTLLALMAALGAWLGGSAWRTRQVT